MQEVATYWSPNPTSMMCAVCKTPHELLPAQETFVKGELPVEAFVGEYTALRKLYYQRELKRQAALQTL